mgnify:CR=1 FL=1
MKSYKLSIIVPVFNVENYIEDCLESIVHQNGDFEIIIVDDGSEDNSIEIASRYTTQFNNISLLHKENGGLSSARNFGMNYAKGDYISFLDSDDILRSDYIYSLMKVIGKSNPDMIVFDYAKGKNNEEIKKNFHSHLPVNQSNNSIAVENFSWLRVVKKSFYNNIRFPEGYLYEDVFVTTLLNAAVNDVIVIPEKIYGYRKREGSITTGSAIKQFSLVDTLIILEHEVESRTLPNEVFALAITNVSKSILINYFRLTKKERRAVSPRLSDLYRKLKFQYAFNSKAKCFDRLIAFFLKFRIINPFTSFFLQPIFKFLDKGWAVHEKK